jgi:hypothetical protein
MARIVVCGYMMRHPVAGNLLAFFHYVLGLKRLGHEVMYLEESGWPNSCYDPFGQEWRDDPEVGMRVVGELIGRHAAGTPAGFVHRETGTVYGMSWSELREHLATADLLINLGGVCWLPEFRSCRRLAYVDLDPLFTQLGSFGAEALGEHHIHFSYGANIGRPGCPIPTAGIDWVPTVPPVVTDLWQNGGRRAGGAPPEELAPFTTIANWGAYGGITHEGRHYGQKDEEFLRILDLPGRTAERLELALSGAGDEVQGKLRAAGWSVRPADDVSLRMETYRAYIMGSRGEFSVAKNAYVATRSGWFSDRSVCYLAAGRPVVLQDSGFSDWLPTGQGVLAFSTVEEARACLERVQADYESQRRAAREVASRHFDHTVVLPRLVEAALAK